ncbi:MAG: class II aldolase/adducin family protein [Gammaproteobacteria bacterium]|nr:class II aldolase/adducin family protein [Gammaproteobacteria bacterium]
MRVLEGRSTTRPVAQAGGVLQLRDDVNCVLHTHIPASTVAATLEDGLMPVIQHALIVFNQIVYVDCDIGNDDDAVRDIVNKMNGKKIAMIRNHGILVAAGSVAGILFLTITLEYACKCQLSALQTGQNLLPFDTASPHFPPPFVARR